MISTLKTSLVVGGSRGLGKQFIAYLLDKKVETYNLSRGICDYPDCRNITLDLLTVTKERVEEAIPSNVRFSSVFFFSRARVSSDNTLQEIVTNVLGPLELLEILAANYLERDSRVCFVSSVNARFVDLRLSLGYHLSKAAIVSAVRYYAVKLAPSGISVNCVSPSTVQRSGSPLLKQDYADVSALKRTCQENDLFETLFFLGFNSSQFLTGQEIVLDGSIGNIWREPDVRY